MNLTPHFTFEELVRSSKADQLHVDNTAGADKVKLQKVAEMLEFIREQAGFPIWVSSAYRCAAVNKAVGGSPTSQHLLCEAADIKACKGHTNKELFNIIKKLVDSKQLTVGQLINEYDYSWVHVSLPRTNGKPNNQILKIG